MKVITNNGAVRIEIEDRFVIAQNSVGIGYRETHRGKVKSVPMGSIDDCLVEVNQRMKLPLAELRAEYKEKLAAALEKEEKDKKEKAEKAK